MFKKIVKKVKEKSLALRLVEIIFKNRSLADLVSIKSSNRSPFENRYEKLEDLYLNGSENNFIAYFMNYIHDIFELIHSMRKENEEVYAELDSKKREIEELSKIVLKYEQNKLGYVTDYIEEKTIDLSKFNTIKYKNAFINYDLEKSHSDAEILIKYNELLNKEKIYLDGVIDSVEYCMNRKNKHTAMHVQLRKNLLTDYGNTTVNMILDETNNILGDIQNE